MQIAIRDNKISMGHARALITIPDVKTQLVILHRILEKKLSVRQVEELVRNLLTAQPVHPHQDNPILPVKFEKVKENLTKTLNAKVELRVHAKGNGSIIIPFRSDDDFDRIASKLEG